MPLDLEPGPSRRDRGDQCLEKAPEATLSDVGSVHLNENSRSDKGQSTLVIPVIEEHLDVSRGLVETGLVHVQKIVHERDVAISEPLAAETLHVERVAMNVIVQSPPAVRTEGEVTVIPVVEEVLVTTKQLRLVEEVRIIRRRDTRLYEESTVLRSEEVKVERQAGVTLNKAGEQRLD